MFYEDEEGDNVCFYIGKGSGKRYKSHLQESRLRRCSNDYKRNKIRKLQRNNKEPFAKILKSELTDKAALQIEKQILERPGVYEELTNLKKGGKGGASLSEETRQKISKAHEGKTLSEEHKRRVGEAFKERTLSEEHKRKVAEGNKGKTLSKKSKEKISKVHKGKTITKETKKKMSKASSGKKNGFYGKSHTEETKRKISKSLSGKREGEDISHSKLTREQVKEIKWLLSNTEKPCSVISKNYPVNQATVGHIKNGISWTHVDGFKKPSKEIREKVSEATRWKEVNEETKEKMSISSRGENCKNSKLTKEEAKEIKWLSLNSDKYQSEIAEGYPITSDSVSQIKNERQWGHVEPKKPQSQKITTPNG